jgi:hypothetical protein
MKAFTSRRLHRAALAVALGIGTGVMAAQSVPAAGDAGSNAMTCWWTADKSAVRIGEPFTLTLTCRVMETNTAAVVPNVSEIEPTSIQLTPFDVLDGARHEDIVTPPWRYLQFVYTVRLLGEEFFGRDLAIPPTNLTFRIRTGSTDAAEGAEHTYVLPSIPIRILSLLPAQAADIRDPSAATFGDIEARRSRSTVALVGGAIFLGFAAVLLMIAGVRAIEHYRKRGPVAERTVPGVAVLGRCVREVDRVRAEAVRDGWTPDLAARALAPFRVAAAMALSQPVAQTLLSDHAPAREGQLAVGYGVLRRRHALVSAPTTAEAIERLRASGNGGPQGRANHDLLDPIRDALIGLNAVRYGRNGSVDVLQLDQTLDKGANAVRRLRIRRQWRARIGSALAKSRAAVGPGAWRH